MAAKPLPSQEVLRQLLRYEPETGKLFWRERSAEWFLSEGPVKSRRAVNAWNARFAGKVAGQLTPFGYRSVCLNRVPYYAHRLVLAMHRGAIEGMVADHVNGNRDDNRIENLRLVSAAGNRTNVARSRRNKSSYCGVIWDEPRHKWRSFISLGGKRTHLGYFENKDDAIQARQTAHVAMGFDPSHGQRAGLYDPSCDYSRARAMAADLLELG